MSGTQCPASIPGWTKSIPWLCTLRRFWLFLGECFEAEIAKISAKNAYSTSWIFHCFKLLSINFWVKGNTIPLRMIIRTREFNHKQAAISSDGRCPAGERMRGISFLMCIRPFLQQGHNPISKPVNRKIRWTLVSVAFSSFSSIQETKKHSQCWVMQCRCQIVFWGE